MFLIKWLRGLKGFLQSDRMKAELEQVAQLVGPAMPIVERVASIIVAATPTAIDDEILKILKAKFPNLFSGQILTKDEWKRVGTEAATELLRQRFPQMRTGVLRTAIELAHLEQFPPGDQS